MEPLCLGIRGWLPLPGAQHRGGRLRYRRDRVCADHAAAGDHHNHTGALRPYRYDHNARSWQLHRALPLAMVRDGLGVHFDQLRQLQLCAAALRRRRHLRVGRDALRADHDDNLDDHDDGLSFDQHDYSQSRQLHL